MGIYYTLYMLSEEGFDSPVSEGEQYLSYKEKIENEMRCAGLNISFIDSADNRLLIADICKRWPELDFIKEIILRNCDAAYYREDYQAKLHFLGDCDSFRKRAVINDEINMLREEKRYLEVDIERMKKIINEMNDYVMDRVTE